MYTLERTTFLGLDTVRHVKLFYISPAMVVEMIKINLTEAAPVLTVCNNIPDGTTVLGIRETVEGGIEILAEHESFEPLPIDDYPKRTEANIDVFIPDYEENPVIRVKKRVRQKA